MARRWLGYSATLFWLGCSDLLTLHVDEQDQVVVEQGTLLEELIGGLGFDGFLDMDITDSSELANQGVKPGDIREVRMEFFELEAIDPPGADLSFLSDVSIYVSAPGLDERLLASAHDFPAGQALVAFTLEDLDLTDYVVSESMTFTTDITGHRPDDDTTVEARMDLAVTATVQGACNQLKGEGDSG